MRTITSLAVLLGLLALCSAQNGPIVDGLVDKIKAFMKPTLNPCDDFYQFACGSFLDKNPVPANVSKTTPYIYWPVIEDVVDHVAQLLLNIVKQPWPYVNDMFVSCDQPATVYAKLFETVFEEFYQIIERVNVSKSEDLWNLIAELNRPGAMRAFLEVYPDETMAHISVAGNIYPYSMYSSSKDYEMLKEEATHAFARFEPLANATQHAIDVIAIENYIAYIQTIPYTPAEWTVEKVTELTKIELANYLRILGVDHVQPDTHVALVGAPEFFQNLTRYIDSLPAVSVRRFLEWKVFNYLAMLNGTTEVWAKNPSIRQTYCSQITAEVLPDLIGMIFVEEVMNDDIISSIRQMTTGIQSAFNASLPALGWLDAQGLAAVRFKLANIIQIIGHPNRLEKYSDVDTSDDNFFHNVFNILSADFAYQLSQSYLPFNRSDYEFDPLIVNAFYSPDTNTINFPAGILESPIYSATWPKLFQYARLGYIVGHENTHGFDNEGSHYDAYGNYSDIFDPKTRQLYTNNSLCIVDVYNKFVVHDNKTVNGRNTLGENIADIGGLKNSYRAYQDYITKNGKEFLDGTLVSGFSTDQVFFLIFAQTTCSVSNNAYLDQQVQYDVHSPTRFRTNGPISQFDKFAQAFKCPVGSPMNPAKKCDLW